MQVTLSLLAKVPTSERGFVTIPSWFLTLGASLYLLAILIIISRSALGRGGKGGAPKGIFSFLINGAVLITAASSIAAFSAAPFIAVISRLIGEKINDGPSQTVSFGTSPAIDIGGVVLLLVAVILAVMYVKGGSLWLLGGFGLAMFLAAASISWISSTLVWWNDNVVTGAWQSALNVLS